MVLPAGGLAVWGRASLLTGSGVLLPGLLITPSPIGEDRLAAGAIRNQANQWPAYPWTRSPVDLVDGTKIPYDN